MIRAPVSAGLRLLCGLLAAEAVFSWQPARLCAAAATVASDSSTFTLALAGDVVFGRFANGRWRAVGGADPLGAAAPLLRQADLALVNLESPLCDQPERWPLQSPRHVPSQIVWLWAKADRAAVLAQAGIDVVSLANNHALDGGPACLSATLRALAANHIVAVGAQSEASDPFEAHIVDSGGIRVAVLAATDRFKFGQPRALVQSSVAADTGHSLQERLVAEVRVLRARRAADVIVVSLHWGLEMTANPQAGQIRLAHALAAAGVDLVVGHHPHVVQPIVRQGRSLVFYSLGNLVFDMTAPAARRAVVALVTLTVTAEQGVAIRALTVQPFDMDCRDGVMKRLTEDRRAGLVRWASQILPGLHWHIRADRLEVAWP